MKSLLACLALICGLAFAGGALACSTPGCRSDDAPAAMTAPAPCPSSNCIVAANAPPPCSGSNCIAAPPPCSGNACLATNAPPPCNGSNCIVEPARAGVELACEGSNCRSDGDDEAKLALAAPPRADALARKTPQLA